jgi:integrase
LIVVAISNLKLVSPATKNRTVAPNTPLRRPNSELRTREHLTPAEVGTVIEAARKNRYGHRDATMILMAYRHGFRPSELVDLEWSQVDFDHAVLHVRRAKRGTPATHPLQGDTLRALRKLRRQAPNSQFVFLSERGFKCHPHMLRHACGYKLANDGKDTRSLQAYLGHKNIQHTVRYTELAPNRFKDFWR